MEIICAADYRRLSGERPGVLDNGDIHRVIAALLGGLPYNVVLRLDYYGDGSPVIADAALHNSRCSRLCVGAYLNVSVVLSVPVCGLGEIVLFTAAHGISAEPITRRAGKAPRKPSSIIPLESDHRAGRGIDRLPA